MKKIILLILIIASMASCKRIRTCECYDEKGKLVASVEIKSTKKHSEALCNPVELGFGTHSGMHCDLKPF